jgi:hypothetical protein
MSLDLKPLVGQTVVSVEKIDYSWFFTFSGGDSLATQASWRLVGSKGLIVTSEDHAQQFGLPEPVNAAKILTDDLHSTPITDANYDSRTGDLFLNFCDQKYIQFLQMSFGYESWKLRIGRKEFICLGSGSYAEFEEDK